VLDRSQPPTQTCLRCRTGISSRTPRALLSADLETVSGPMRARRRPTARKTPLPRVARLSGAASRHLLPKFAGFRIGAVNAGGAFPTSIRTRYSESAVPMTERADDGTRPAGGEMRGRADLSRETSRCTKAGPWICRARRHRSYTPRTESGSCAATVRSTDVSPARRCARLATRRTRPVCPPRPRFQAGAVLPTLANLGHRSSLPQRPRWRPR